MQSTEKYYAWFPDTTKLVTAAFQFEELVHDRNHHDGQPISFQRPHSFPNDPEGYKDIVYAKARTYLGLSSDTAYQRKDFAERAKKAINVPGNNLIYPQQKRHFQKCLFTEDNKVKLEAEQVLYDFYDTNCRVCEEEQFNRLTEVFKNKYDLISFLYFVKDSNRYTPVMPGSMERALLYIGVDYRLKGQCSFSNYTQFLNMLGEIKEILEDVWPGLYLSLLDVQTFLWELGAKDKDKKETYFQQWLSSVSSEVMANVESSVESYFDGKFAEGPDTKQQKKTAAFSHSAEVARITKKRANGLCELCGICPFMDRSGIPYLESHHIIWRSQGGKDNTDNTAALCPNCHTKMHINPQAEDISYLKMLRSKRT